MSFQFLYRHPAQHALLRLAPIQVDAVHIGGDDEQVGFQLARQQLAGQVFVDHGFDAGQPALFPGSYMVGIPPPPAQITIVPCSSSHLTGRISKIRLGSGEGTTRRHLPHPA